LFQYPLVDRLGFWLSAPKPDIAGTMFQYPLVDRLGFWHDDWRWVEQLATVSVSSGGSIGVLVSVVLSAIQGILCFSILWWIDWGSGSND